MIIYIFRLKVIVFSRVLFAFWFLLTQKIYYGFYFVLFFLITNVTINLKNVCWTKNFANILLYQRSFFIKHLSQNYIKKLNR